MTISKQSHLRLRFRAEANIASLMGTILVFFICSETSNPSLMTFEFIHELRQLFTVLRARMSSCMHTCTVIGRCACIRRYNLHLSQLIARYRIGKSTQSLRSSTKEPKRETALEASSEANHFSQLQVQRNRMSLPCPFHVRFCTVALAPCLSFGFFVSLLQSLHRRFRMSPFLKCLMSASLNLCLPIFFLHWLHL